MKRRRRSSLSQWKYQWMIQGRRWGRSRDILNLLNQSPSLTVSPRMQSEFSGKEAELVPGVLRGYREWRLNPSGNLMAVNFEIPWGRGKNTAWCAKGQVNYPPTPHSNAIPEANCTCGFYARHEPTGFGLGSVVGSVKAYGKIILGTLGFRAQFVEIEAVAVSHDIRVPPLSDVLSATREIYQIDIFGNLDQLVKAFPPIPVNHLLEREEPILSPREEAERLYRSGVTMSLGNWNDWIRQWRKGL